MIVGHPVSLTVGVQFFDAFLEDYRNIKKILTAYFNEIIIP